MVGVDCRALVVEDVGVASWGRVFDDQVELPTKRLAGVSCVRKFLFVKGGDLLPIA